MAESTPTTHVTPVYRNAVVYDIAGLQAGKAQRIKRGTTNSYSFLVRPLSKGAVLTGLNGLKSTKTLSYRRER